MAATEITLIKAELNEGVNMAEAQALDKTDGAYLPFTGQDTKLAILLTGTGTVVVKAGDGIQGVADLSVVIGTNGSLVELDSGAFKITQGEHKGKVHITGPATAKAQILQLI